MALRSILADRARVTTPTTALDTAQQIFALLGPGGTCDLIEALLAHMDELDGDLDREDGDEDRCAAGDDDVQDGGPCLFGPGDGKPGDPEDAESLLMMAGGGSAGA